MSAELSVIIPSKLRSNLKPCLEAIWLNEPNLSGKVIWIDDSEGGLDCRLAGVRRVQGQKPFVFARNVNMGIRIAGDDDVIVLNDDALLETPGGFTAMQRAARKNEGVGVIGAVTNVTGQPLQLPRKSGAGSLRLVPHFAFVCVLIPRRTIDRVGLLDERYCLDYGVEDRDYCEACRRAGLLSAVFDDCYVDHGSMTSTFRGDPRAPLDYSRNKALFEEKWGPETWGATA